MTEQLEIIFNKGGIMMIPLSICSFLVILIALERVLVLRKNRLLSPHYLKNWKSWFSDGMQLNKIPVTSRSALINQLLLPVVTHLPLSESKVEEKLVDISRKIKNRLERGLVYLDTIAGIAPLFGLLGTALGMVEVFSRLSGSGETKMEALSSGISEALYTTVTGLVIGIPALIAYNLLSRQIDNLLLIADEQVNDLLTEFKNSIYQP
ncbi:MAG: MotA/TolQ/ExbB proton channel family protein [Deltaproteobacteria bacterium]|jgi:biopolymer transport protein ExbB|nr:MotA/TolQ/ExbB proton channel family protein [Deltaproteobacteria bacterium]MBT4527689.1 MotA/TolQ/ExbB proton channel family protein [Deltaproteobacteria bacterium]